MVHIIFGASAFGTLKYILKQQGHLNEEQIITVEDYFSIGPVWHLHEEAGKESRFLWMKTIFKGDDFRVYKKHFNNAVSQIKNLSEKENIIIWLAENASEITGLLYVMNLLTDKENKIQIINLTSTHKALFGKPNVDYRILSSGEMPPEKWQIIYEKMNEYPILIKEARKNLEQDWISLTENSEKLRIWKEGRINSIPEDSYDKFIIQRAKKLQSQKNADYFIKSARLIGEVLGRLDQYFGMEFLEYRLKKLIEKEIFEVEGDLEAMRFYSVRIKQMPLNFDRG